nr:MAG TPA: hypothetical protein [Caudoviricetes sp.]
MLYTYTPPPIFVQIYKFTKNRYLYLKSTKIRYII